MKLENFTYTITGITPLLTHNASAMGDGPKMKAAKDRIPSPEVEAERGLYRLSDGSFGIPLIAFRSAIIKAASGRKVGKKSAASVIAPAIFADETLCQLLDPATGTPLTTYELDRRRAVVQRQGIMRTRPKFPSWMVNLGLTVDSEIVPRSAITECLVDAGQVVGVGDYRPENKGWFGRFVVQELEAL